MTERIISETLKKFISESLGSEDFDLIPLPKSGSERRYFRFSIGGKNYIATFVPDHEEGRCFVCLAERFREANRDVPEIIAVSEDFRCYIQEDLGSDSLFSLLGFPEAKTYIGETLIRLAHLQKTPVDVWQDYCMAKPFSRRQAMWDLNYFKYEFLKLQEVVFDENRLEDDFDSLSERLVSENSRFYGFMMRDCQSRNVMITESGPVFIDFQGGRLGPALYDAVSFLWQARAGFDNKFRTEMLDLYCNAFCNGDKKLKSEMLANLDDFILFRTLQVLGAYGFRGLVQHKPHFLLSIPGALANLRELLERGAIDFYPELKKCVETLISGFISIGREEYDGLTVEIFSFSYKNGYPVDMSGNGGGFMFDCRSLHNPGRYPKYRTLTGRDEAVIAFLELFGEVEAYLKSAWSLTDAAVERYLRRGFTHLQIGFGCTGGQHRSVYCAERTAAHVKDLFPEVNVKITHREHPKEKDKL